MTEISAHAILWWFSAGFCVSLGWHLAGWLSGKLLK